MTIPADSTNGEMPKAAEIPAERGRARWPGRAALALGILTPLAVVGGIAAVALDAYAVATVLSWVAIGASMLAVAGGIVAMLGNWGRGAAIGGVALGMFGNPVVLLYGLGALGAVGGA